MDPESPQCVWRLYNKMWKVHRQEQISLKDILRSRRCPGEWDRVIFLLSEVAQSCLTLCDPMDCSLSGSSIHGIFQARVLEWIAISFSRGSSQPRNRTPVFRIAGRRFTSEPPGNPDPNEGEFRQKTLLNSSSYPLFITIRSFIFGVLGFFSSQIWLSNKNYNIEESNKLCSFKKYLLK